MADGDRVEALAASIARLEAERVSVLARLFSAENRLTLLGVALRDAGIEVPPNELRDLDRRRPPYTHRAACQAKGRRGCSDNCNGPGEA